MSIVVLISDARSALVLALLGALHLSASALVCVMKTDTDTFGHIKPLELCGADLSAVIEARLSGRFRSRLNAFVLCFVIWRTWCRFDCR